MLLAACGGVAGSTTPTASHHKLTIGGFVGEAFTKATSPFNSSANIGTLGMVYEPLFFANLNSGQYTPLLGQSSSWNSDNTQLTVNLRTGVLWNDGQSFSSADVVYTFKTVLTEAKGVADTNGLWTYLSDVSAPDANSVLFTFKKAYTPVAYYVLSQTYIVPQHIWSTSVTNPTTDNPALVGTGPFTQTRFTSTLLVYARNTKYWNNAQNKIDELQYPAVKDNQTLEQELIAGQIDWGSFGADASLKSAYVGKDPTHNKYWFSSSAIVGLYLNDSQAPFNDANVRLAISAALDRSAMSTQAENSYESPANSAGVATNNSAQLNATSGTVQTSPDLTKVASLLTASGYAKGSDGFYTKNGQKIVVKYNVPSDWSDWVAVATIMKSNLQAAGIDGEVNAIADDAYFTARASGSFEAMIGGLFAGPTPYYLYNTHLNSTNDATKGGFNWGHYKSAAFDSLLQQYAATSDTTTQAALINQMEALYAKDMPVVPLLNAANWFEYSTKHYTGWPSQSNPYAMGPTYDAPGNEQVVTHLVPVN
jgi:peptide/nickel transport system substrate-binding protein